jgi:hypothetical protein
MRNNDYEAIYKLLGDLVAQGTPCPLLTIVGPDEMDLRRVHAISPETLIVLRVWPGGGSGYLSIEDYYNQNIRGNPNRDLPYVIHQFNNEIADFTPGRIQWWKDQILLAVKLGLKIAVLTAPTGNPSNLNDWKRQDIVDLLRLIRQYGMYLALHEYYMSDGDWDLDRFFYHVMPLLPQDLQDNPPFVIFTEYGVAGAGVITEAALIADMTAWQRTLYKFRKFVKGAALWTVGDTGNVPPPENWTADNFIGRIRLLLGIGKIK